MNTSTFQEDSSKLGQYIPFHYHANMLRDKARMESFKQAIEKVVPQGGKVVELGGGTGVLSFFAAHRASKVWCVEKNPELLGAARRIIALNPFAEKIELVEADAATFLPPEPVDVVVCEMLHSALLREKQIDVIDSFKARYRQKFGKLPVFIPEGVILAVQPVQQAFQFMGYYAPVPMFYDPLAATEETRGLGDPANYKMFFYAEDLPKQFACEVELPITGTGTVNALRFITKNVLAAIVTENRSIDWFSQYLVLPLPSAVVVQRGDVLRARFQYRPGDAIEVLTQSISVTKK